MATARAGRKVRIAPDAGIADGQVGSPADRRTDPDGTTQGKDGWGAFALHLLSIEKEHKHRRIVRVWHPDADADLWHGEFGCAPVESGSHAYQFNNGEVVELSGE